MYIYCQALFPKKNCTTKCSKGKSTTKVPNRWHPTCGFFLMTLQLQQLPVELVHLVDVELKAFWRSASFSEANGMMLNTKTLVAGCGT